MVQSSPLLKVTSFNSLSVIIKMITGLGVSKLSAYFLGPQGFALIGNFRNFLNIAHNFSAGGLERAVVKYGAESENEQEKQKAFISSLLGMGLLVCLIVGILIFSFSTYINRILFYERNFTQVIQILAFILPLHVLNIYIIALLKAFEEFQKIIRVHIIGHVLNLVVFALLVYNFDLKGALITLIIIPSALVFFSLYYFKAYWSIFSLFDWKAFDSKMLKNFGHYALMTLISSVSFPLVFLGIRNSIITELSEEAAGFWEAVNRIATYYLMFVLSMLNLFILPKLVKAKNNIEFKSIVFAFYKQIIPLYVIGLILVYFIREPLLLLVYTDEFLPAENLFLYQILGDFFRIITLVMVYQFHAKRMTISFILTDLFLAVSLYFSATMLIGKFGLEGAVIGHFITYVAYFLLILIYFRKVFIYPYFKLNK
ncbi:O-antigen translocase [Psychroflexus planctonicus]|uniref:O-antigen translocase n=1 Tax=Psychroflexus planctonicus TaxID=1526575 RepID=UPI001E61A697|nr:O-antigen translocase [Psychroflexus planctonicus]